MIFHFRICGKHFSICGKLAVNFFSCLPHNKTLKYKDKNNVAVNCGKLFPIPCARACARMCTQVRKV